MEEEIAIYFLRHGRSRADDERVHEGRYDSPLTDAGRSQVQAPAEALMERGVQFDFVISSVLMRASESARIIGDLLGVPVEMDEVWMEMDNRPLAGLPYEVAEAKYPKPAFRNPYESFHGVGESETALVLTVPLDPSAALDRAAAWFAQPSVEPLDPGPRHLSIVRTLFVATQVAGRLTTDTHPAALAIEHQCELHSNDHDFERFPGLRWRNPLRAA